MTHAQLLSDFRRAVRNKSASAEDFDYYANITLPTFLRYLFKWDLHLSHLTYIPKLILTLSSDTWEYSWLDVSKYTSTSITPASGVFTVAGAKSTYFLSQGDLATFASTEYPIVDVASGTFTIDTSVSATGTLVVYARPLFFTDAYAIESGATAGTDEIPIKREQRFLPPNRHNSQDGDLSAKPKWRQRGDKIEISWNPGDSDKLHLYYIPEPIVFDNSNAMITALSNPTQMTSEGNRAFAWAMAENYWMQKGAKDEVLFCQSMYDRILRTAGVFGG